MYGVFLVGSYGYTFVKCCKNLNDAIHIENFEVSLTAGLAGYVRPTSTRNMAPDFLHNKGI